MSSNRTTKSETSSRCFLVGDFTPRKAWAPVRALFVFFNPYYFIGFIFLLV